MLFIDDISIENCYVAFEHKPHCNMHFATLKYKHERLDLEIIAILFDNPDSVSYQ